MTVTIQVPPPHPADSGEVTEALDVASELWRTGKRPEAIRWVKRAAQAADEAGDSVRMGALARASVDLEESLTVAPLPRSSAPPPVPPHPQSSLPPGPASASRVRSKATPPPLPRQTSRPAPTATTPPEGRLRFRVAIKTSVLDPTLLVVRRLEEGMALPAGTREGWLESTNVEQAHANGKSTR